MIEFQKGVNDRLNVSEELMIECQKGVNDWMLEKG